MNSAILGFPVHQQMLAIERRNALGLFFGTRGSKSKFRAGGMESAASFRVIGRRINSAGKKLILLMIVPISQEAGLINRDFFLYGEFPMKTSKVAPWALTFERRRFGRIHIFEPRRCHIHLPNSKELWTDQGILVNISLGGIYFVCDQQPPLEKDDICYLTFDNPYADPKGHYLGLHVLVVRTEQVQLHLSQFAVALRIISAPVYYSPHKTNNGDYTSLDKLGIMYHYYDLNKKVYEIVTNTSEIRTDKINIIKEIIDKGCYKVKPDKVTKSLINDLFLEDILRLKS